MPFTLPDPPTPAQIGEINIEITDIDGTNPNRSMRATVQTLDANGSPSGNWNGNVVPHLTQAQISGLIALMDALRAKAEAELIP